MNAPLYFIFLGLSITSSWGNGHATPYRGLVRELALRGHRVLFLERDQPWYADHRDYVNDPDVQVELYSSLDQLKERFTSEISHATAVIVGSYVPDGILVGEWVLAHAAGVAAFYDIDTPVTLASLERGGLDYLSPELVPRYHLYLSFTGGPTLDLLHDRYGAPMARPLYCSVDPQLYYLEEHEKKWDAGYLGTYSADRQPALRHLLLEPAGRWPGGFFVVAGPQYPKEIQWPANLERIEHLPPFQHRRFYNEQCLTLNITRAPMIAAGYSPSVRLFEAAACATPVMSDYWQGLETFFEPGEEILVTRSAEDTLNFLLRLPQRDRQEIGERARQRVLKEHTSAHRAAELESYICELLHRQAPRRGELTGAAGPAGERPSTLYEP
jgi:spore maturation protein CgeB